MANLTPVAHRWIQLWIRYANWLGRFDDQPHILRLENEREEAVRQGQIRLASLIQAQIDDEREALLTDLMKDISLMLIECNQRGLFESLQAEVGRLYHQYPEFITLRAQGGYPYGF
jgi:hypothetical protein